jgi:hypothetical protein
MNQGMNPTLGRSLDRRNEILLAVAGVLVTVAVAAAAVFWRRPRRGFAGGWGCGGRLRIR